MKKMTTLGAVLVMLLSVGAFTASAALANEGIWMESGAQIASPTHVSWKSSLSLENWSEAKGSFKYGCTLTVKGIVTTKGQGEITSITNASGGSAITCSLVEPGMECLGSPTIEALNLPWKTQLNKEDRLLYTQVSPAWKITCEGGSVQKCEQAPSTEVKNNSGGVGVYYGNVAKKEYKETSGCASGGTTHLETSGEEEMKIESSTRILSVK
jgi:hypothetical protein